jgi:hypothetical protein
MPVEAVIVLPNHRLEFLVTEEIPHLHCEVQAASQRQSDVDALRGNLNP